MHWSDKLFWWTGFLAFLGAAIGMTCWIWSWALLQIFVAGRTTVWITRFIWHWRAFDEWYKANRYSKTDDVGMYSEAAYIPAVKTDEASKENPHS